MTIHIDFVNWRRREVRMVEVSSEYVDNGDGTFTMYSTYIEPFWYKEERESITKEALEGFDWMEKEGDDDFH